VLVEVVVVLGDRIEEIPLFLGALL